MEVFAAGPEDAVKKRGSLRANLVPDEEEVIRHSICESRVATHPSYPQSLLRNRDITRG